MFDIKVAIGQVDRDLVNEISKIIPRDDKGRFSEMWDPAGDPEVPHDIYGKYNTQLYGLLVTLSEGETTTSHFGGPQ
eukprot:2558343-Karenia_brevis.AAC.1